MSNKKGNLTQLVLAFPVCFLWVIILPIGFFAGHYKGLSVLTTRLIYDNWA